MLKLELPMKILSRNVLDRQHWAVKRKEKLHWCLLVRNQMRLNKVRFTEEKENGFDGGIDIVLYDKTIDVKAMGRKYATRANYVNNFTKLQIHYDCDILLFTSVNKVKNLIEFCGYIWKSEIDTLGTLHKKGSIRKRGRNDNFKLDVDNYEVINSDLRNIRDIIDWSYFGF